MLIGQLSKKTGFSRDTLRFYEKNGIISPEGRHDNSYKDYPEQTVQILNAVRALKAQGFSLIQIRDFIRLFSDQNMSCRSASHLIEKKMEELDQKISELKNMKKELGAALKKCKNHPNGKTCRVLSDVFGE